MNKKITLAAVCTIVAFGVGVSVIQSAQNAEKYSKVFYLDATYYHDKNYVRIKFDDTSGKTTSVVLEILGMQTSYQKAFTGTSFEIQVPFDGVPEYGWKTMPITLVVDHQEFGKVGLKTEVHNPDEPPNKIIYSKL